jgi:hypothetical protein
VSTNEIRRPPSASRTRHAPTRSVFAEGFHWRVFEVSDRSATPAGRSLVFEHDLAWRRIRRYPANWFELAESALIVLLTLT